MLSKGIFGITSNCPIKISLSSLFKSGTLETFEAKLNGQEHSPIKHCVKKKQCSNGNGMPCCEIKLEC